MTTTEKPAAQAAASAPEMPAKPSYQNRADAVAGLASTPASSTGKKGKGDKGRTKKGSGPVTIVTLAGDNSTTQTVFIPATGMGTGRSSSSSSAMATGGSTVLSTQTGSSTVASAPERPVILPQSPAAVSRGRERTSASSRVLNIDLKQYFDVISADGSAVKKVLTSIKPDIEALIRRALEKLAADRRRTHYAQ